MYTLLWRCLKISNYVKAFGLLDGVRLQAANEFGLVSRQDGRLRLRVPGLAAPVLLRPSGSDRPIFWQCFVTRQYDLSRFPAHHAALQTRYAALVSQGKTPLIVDCGGNIGLSALWFARAFPRATVVVVEPDAENFAMLQANVAPLGSRVVAVRGCVWPRRESMAMCGPECGTAGCMVAPAGPGGQSGDQSGGAQGDHCVAALTMDDLLALAPGAEPLLVKIDIEGSQQALFAENIGWVERFPCIIMELEDWLFPWRGTSGPFFACLSRLAMEYLIYGENIFCFSHSLRPASEGAGR